ncbi:MAG: M16 family metallopeptidase, partial [Schleiferiaceae bacterium]
MRKYIYTLFIALLTISLSAQVTIDRSTAPTPGPARTPEIGSYESFELKNGLKVFVVEDHKLPRITMSLILDRDPIVEGAKAGYVSIAGDLIGAGTANRTKSALDEEVDFMGANFGTGSNSIRVGGLSKYTDQLIDILSDVLLNPSFPEEEFEKLKSQMISGLKANADDPDAISGNLRGAALYGLEHPYGEVMTEATVEAISIDDCKAYFDTYFRPNIAYMVVIGDITVADAKKKLNKALKKWKAAEVPAHDYAKTSRAASARIVMVDKPSAVQSVVWLGNVIDLPQGHPDIEPLRLANEILGGRGASGRLFLNLREDKGYTYGAYSNFGVDELNATFGASAKVRNEVTDSAITEFLYEINRMKNESVTEEDLVAAKASLSGSFGRSLESPASAANFALNIARYNLPSDYYNNYLSRLEGVTAEDVMRVANTYMNGPLTITVVGKAQDVAGKLSAFGEVEYFDAEGNATEAPTFLFMPEGITKESVLNNYFEAIGGAEAFQNITSFEQEMSLEAPGMPGAVGMKTVKNIPDYYLSEQSMQGMTLMKVEYKDGAATRNGMRGNAELEGEELASTAKEAKYVISQLEWLENPEAITFDGQTLVNGKDVYQITEGEQTHYFDVATGLLYMSVETAEGPEGDITVTTVF